MRKLVSLFLAMALLLTAAIAIPASAEDYVKLTWAQATGGTAPSDNAMVLEELNKISREKLGLEVDIQYFTNDQLKTATLAGEVFDIYTTCGWFNDYVINARDGLFADITEEIKTVTPDLYASMTEDVWELSKVGGTIYMIPNKKDIGYQCYFTYNKDFYDSIGMTWPEKITKFDEITPFLAAYAEHHPGEYGFMFSKNPAGIGAADAFVSLAYNLGFNLNDPDAGIHCLYEDAQVLERAATVAEWMKAGYVNPDAATVSSVDSKHDHVKIEAAWDGYDFTPTYGYTAGMCKIGDVYLSAGNVRTGNALSAALEEDPDRLALALKYLELVNLNTEYRDILNYGVPGVHFNYREDGAVIRTEKGLAGYQPWGFMQGSFTVRSIESTGDVPIVADQWEQAYAAYATAKVAPDYGFAFDNESVENICTEIDVVNKKYYDLILSGTVPTYEYAEMCIKEMEEVGLRELQAEIQRQYDEFMANKDK